MSLRRRVLFYLIVVILPAVLLGCRKKVPVTRPSNIMSDNDKLALMVVDLCDPTKQAHRIAEKGESDTHTRLLCAVGMKKVEEDLDMGKIRNGELQKFIMKYKAGLKEK